MENENLYWDEDRGEFVSEEEFAKWEARKEHEMSIEYRSRYEKESF